MLQGIRTKIAEQVSALPKEFVFVLHTNITQYEQITNYKNNIKREKNYSKRNKTVTDVILFTKGNSTNNIKKLLK